MTLLLDPVFSSVAFGHLIVDLLNAQRPLLLTFLSVPLGLTNTAIAVISTSYVLVSALSQPLFGWLADRLGTRWLATIGILWMGLFFSLAMSFQGMGALPLLILAGLGSGAFHPSGAKEATLRGQTHFNGREITAASYFFFFGQSALFFGPIIGGPILDHFGTHGLLILAVFTLPIGLYANWQLRKSNTPTGLHNTETAGEEMNRLDRTSIIALALIIVLQAWTQQNMITFLPKYLFDLGQTATIYGMIAALFMGGSALGNVLGGYLADVFGKQRLAMTALALASLPLFAISKVGWSSWLYLLVPLAGALTGSVHSILVVTAQRSIPGGMALASGLTFGFMFSAGALGTLLSGPLADAWGFPPVFQMTAILTLIAAGLTLFLTRTPRSLISK